MAMSKKAGENEGVPTRHKNQRRKNHGRWPLGKREKRGVKPSQYQMTYNKSQTTAKKAKATRSTQGTIPSFLDHNGKISTLFGHSVLEIDNRTTFRAVFQNPNGINPHPGNYQFAMSLQECYDLCISLIGLSETNREWKHFAQQQQLKEAVHKTWKASVIQTSSSNERFDDNYKPGGTVTIICEDHWTARVIEKGEDPWGLGRWSYVLLAGKKNRRVLQVTGYRVCKSSASSAGETTAYKQQYNILRSRIQGTIDPRRQGVLDMQVWLAFFIAQGVEVILYLDGNEDLKRAIGKWCELPQYIPDQHQSSQEHDGSLATLVTTLGLVDVLLEQHQGDIPVTYTRGTKRLDYVFVTPKVMASVERSSMLPFHALFGGDHRAILIDFNAKLLFGDESYEIQRQRARGLRLHDPRIANKYLETLVTQLEYHKVFEKAEVLKDRSDSGAWVQEACVREYIKIYNILTDSVRYADRMVAKRYSTRYEWSPELIRSVNAVRYWELRLKMQKGFSVDSVVVQKLREAAKLPFVHSDEIRERSDIVASLRAAKQHMYQNQKNHIELRRQYLEELAEAILLNRRPWLEEDGYEQQKHEQTEKQLKELIRREEARKMHRTIGALLKNGFGKGLLQVDIPDAAAVPPPGTSFGDPNDGKTWKGPWLSIKEPEEMAKEIAKANIRAYNQAHPTPFASGPLGDSLGKYADTPMADRILRGDPLPPHIVDPLMEETKRMITILGEKPRLVPHKLSTNITAEDFCSMYKVVDERISSSPSQRHVGTYKVATKSPALARLYASLLSLPWTEGFSIPRWQVVLDVMLPKEENNWRISRLRIIQLYESDVNQSMRHIFARQIGFLMEDSGLVPDMQFGSRPGRMSISPVLQKVLTYDIARSAKLVIACVENDAIGCYDRIVNVLGYLLLRRLGVPQKAISSLGETWANMVHVIRTAYGRSNSAYCSTPSVPLFGAGQGSTNGPFFWLLMFTLMNDSIDPSLRTILFISACAALVASRVGDAFVDDSHLGATSSYEDDPRYSMEDNVRLHELQVLEDITKLAQHYERLLWSTGGALNILKCSWVLISWIWKNGRAILANSSQAPAELMLTSGSSPHKQRVPRLQPSETYRTLGVFISGDGCQKRSKEILRGHAATFAGRIGPAVLNPVTAFYAFQLYLCPKLGYALPVSSFSFKDSGYIQAPALMSILPKLKLNRNTARAIVHGPNLHGGLKLKHVYCEQGNGQLRLLLGHLRNRDHTGDLIRVAMSYMQITVGSTELFLNLPHSKYAKWIERSWLKSVWEFLDRTKLSVHIRRAWVPKKQREGDSTLMSIFIESGYGHTELAQLNRCRLFHQVFFTSDIATADGKYIDASYRRGKPNPDRTSQWKWPAQGQPDRQAWRLWDRALSHLEYHGKLRVQLGEWLTPSHQTWAWMIHIPTQVVARHHEGQKTYYQPLIRGNTRQTAQLYDLEIITPEPDGLPSAVGWANATATFLETSSVFSINYSGEICTANPPILDEPVATYASFHDQIRGAPLFFTRLVGQLPALTDATLDAIQLYIKEGTLLTCSDGSYEPELGTGSQAWVFSDSKGHILWCGAGPIDGFPDMITSYRSELGGITTILFLLRQILDFFELATGAVTLFCDNTSALENVFQEHPKRGIYPLLERDYDLLGVARQLWHQLPIKITPAHVKGHYKGQEREIKHDLNDLADTMAEEFLKAPPEGFQPQRMPILHPEFEAVLIYSDSIITTKFRDIVYSQMFSEPLAANIQRKLNWTAAQFAQISWEAYGAAFRTQTIFRQIATAKLSHDLWNSGAQKKLYGQDSEGLCPVCGNEVETMDHIFQCSNPDTMTLKRSLLATLYEDMAMYGTPSAILLALQAGLEWWLLGHTSGCPRAPGFGSIYGTEVWATTAYVDQTNLGWGQMLRGRVSKLWGEAYVKATKSSKPKEHHLKWTKKLIQNLWSLSFDLWGNRNGVLHGQTVADRLNLQHQALLDRIADLYSLYQDQPSIIHASAQYLFEQPLASLLSKTRQYLKCWIRSVEVAIQHQETETSRLRQQAQHFFGLQPIRNHLEAGMVGSSTRQRNLQSVDITTPEKYNLRQRRRHIDIFQDSDSDDTIIPPAMFDEPTDSSYTGSDREDVRLIGFATMSSTEVAGLGDGGGSFSGDNSGSKDDSYTSSGQSDTTLPEGYISPSEVLSLQGSPQPAPSTPGTDIRTLHHRSPRLTRYYAGPLAPIREEVDLAPGPVSPAAVQSTNSSDGTNTQRLPRFPLWAIGALQPPTSTSPSTISPLYPEPEYSPSLNVFQVLEECRGDTPSELWLPLGQPSGSMASTSGTSAHSSIATMSRPDLETVVNCAETWLRDYHPDNRAVSLSPSIYWSIRSLRPMLLSVASHGRNSALLLLNMDDDDAWPDPPEEEDNFDLTMLPEWLRVFLTLNNILEWGLRGVRGFSASHQRAGLRWPAQMELPIADIPKRELDDPPDIDGGDALGVWDHVGEGADSYAGLIVELSKNTIEDNTSG